MIKRSKLNATYGQLEAFLAILELWTRSKEMIKRLKWAYIPIFITIRTLLLTFCFLGQNFGGISSHPTALEEK